MHSPHIYLYASRLKPLDTSVLSEMSVSEIELSTATWTAERKRFKQGYAYNIWVGVREEKRMILSEISEKGV